MGMSDISDISAGSDNQKVYPSLGVQPLHPSQMHQPGFQPQQQFPPEQQGYPHENVHMGPPAYGPQVITQQPTTVFVQAPRLDHNPQMMTCPSCRTAIQTNVKYEPATKTHLIAAVICLCGCWAGCCLIPYCVDSCQNATHSCPSCGTYLGTHK